MLSKNDCISNCLPLLEDSAVLDSWSLEDNNPCHGKTFKVPVNFDDFPDNCIRCTKEGWVFKFSNLDLGSFLRVGSFPSIKISQCIFSPHTDEQGERIVQTFVRYPSKFFVDSNFIACSTNKVYFDAEDFIKHFFKSKVYIDQFLDDIFSGSLIRIYGNTWHISESQCDLSNFLNLRLKFIDFEKCDDISNQLNLTILANSTFSHNLAEDLFVKPGCIMTTNIMSPNMVYDRIQRLFFFICTPKDLKSSHQDIVYGKNLNHKNFKKVRSMYPKSWFNS